MRAQILYFIVLVDVTLRLAFSAPLPLSLQGLLIINLVRGQAVTSNFYGPHPLVTAQVNLTMMRIYTRILG